MIRRTIALLFISIPSVISAFSQTGTLTGIVKDAYSNESLPGASIVLFEITTGTTSDTNGRYEFRNRSEEHTSGLQSRVNLVCRFLLVPRPIHLLPFPTRRSFDLANNCLTFYLHTIGNKCI